MNSSQTLLFDQVQAKGQNSPKRTRLFYSGNAALLLVLMFLGFLQFYLHGRTYPNSELVPPIRTLLILHSIGMTAWALLIVAGNHRVHMMLGRIRMAINAIVEPVIYAGGTSNLSSPVP